MVIKVNQVCLNYFVEKNVPMVNFVLSDSQGGISPPDRTHRSTRRGIHSPENRCVCHLRCFRVPKTHAGVWQL